MQIACDPLADDHAVWSSRSSACLPTPPASNCCGRSSATNSASTTSPSVGKPAPSVSQHLAKLRMARLVRTRRGHPGVLPAGERPRPPTGRAVFNAEQPRATRHHRGVLNCRGTDGTSRRHSHDHADASTRSAPAGAVKISLVVLTVTAALQIAIVVASGSVALLADTIHNFSDALTAIPLWIAVLAEPAKRDQALHLRFRKGRGSGRSVRGRRHRAVGSRRGRRGSPAVDPSGPAVSPRLGRRGRS